VILRSRHPSPRAGRGLRKGGALAIIAVAAAAIAGAQRGAAPAQAPAPARFGAGANWTTYLGDAGRTHYSTLTQIDRRNVVNLRVAWTYDTGDRGEFQSNNLVIDGVLFTASPTRKVIALDAATGRELWKFDATTERPGGAGARQRGVVYWANPQGGEARIFTGVGNYLYALDARTGTPIRTFAEKGALHLGTGTERDGGPRLNITLNTPGLIYKDMYIVTGITNQPGSVRAYDVRTGAMRWIFNLVPREGEFGADTWPATGPGSSGGASNWTGSALDDARGIVYVPTESATPDFWGGDRKGANLFANSLVALDAATGKRLWHYQIYRHDLFDRDLPTPPVLLTVTHRGRRIDAVAQGTKHGLLFVFNRETGEPLWPIHERAVAQTDVPGEFNWPAQPVPEKPAPLMRQAYTEADASTISPEANAMTRERAARMGSSGPFPTPSLKPTIMFPGYDGGMEWGGAAADPQGTYYVNVNEIPWTYQLIPTRRADGSPLSLGERGYLTQCASCHGLERKGEVASGFPPLVDLHTKPRDYANGIVERGGPGRMPAFGQDLPEGQRRAILDHLYGVEQPEAAYQTAGRGRGGASRGAGAGEAPPAAGAAPPGAAGAPAAVAAGNRGRGAAAPYAFTGFQRMTDRERYPAIKPPWGTLNAVDLNTGEIKWKVPLGEYPELTKRGIPPTGTENYGGPVVTATGLIFIGATADETIRAFDKDTGKILWQAALPFGGNATPSVYMAGGRQYLVISAGGAKSGRPAGGSIVAFALPR
jgi:quinoprotein glucose dehydrogenase